MINVHSRGIFRETIDLNRYSNSVAKKYAVTYNEIIVNAAKNSNR